MAYKSNIFLGRIIKVSGFEGAVIVKLEKIFSENIPRMESVFLEVEGRQVPFFISYSEYSGADILKLKFEGYDSVEKIREFTGCNIYLTSNILHNNQSEEIESLKEYKVLLSGDKLLGSITEIIQNPGQLLLNVISTDNKEILIPFHDHLIVSIDKKNKIIVMDIPDGLTEIN
ncbi:MAG: ribosome maturation factor RimM [Bacteroidales bacterium]|nr:ribosome maturation factor RimM [Bacteroidales bacterium]